MKILFASLFIEVDNFDFNVNGNLSFIVKNYRLLWIEIVVHVSFTSEFVVIFCFDDLLLCGKIPFIYWYACEVEVIVNVIEFVRDGLEINDLVFPLACSNIL